MTVAIAGQARPRRVGLGRRLRGDQNRNLWFWAFVGPFVVGLVVFVIVPIGWSLYLSFHEAKGTITPTRAVGLANYSEMLRDPARLPDWMPPEAVEEMSVWVEPGHVDD